MSRLWDFESSKWRFWIVFRPKIFSNFRRAWTKISDVFWMASYSCIAAKGLALALRQKRVPADSQFEIFAWPKESFQATLPPLIFRGIHLNPSLNQRRWPLTSSSLGHHRKMFFLMEVTALCRHHRRRPFCRRFYPGMPVGNIFHVGAIFSASSKGGEIPTLQRGSGATPDVDGRSTGGFYIGCGWTRVELVGNHIGFRIQQRTFKDLGCNIWKKTRFFFFHFSFLNWLLDDHCSKWGVTGNCHWGPILHHTCMKPLKPCEIMGKILPGSSSCRIPLSGTSVRSWVEWPKHQALTSTEPLGLPRCENAVVGISVISTCRIIVYLFLLSRYLHTYTKKNPICTNICRFFPLDAMDASNRIQSAICLRHQPQHQSSYHHLQNYGEGWEDAMDPRILKEVELVENRKPHDFHQLLWYDTWKPGHQAYDIPSHARDS